MLKSVLMRMGGPMMNGENSFPERVLRLDYGKNKQALVMYMAH
jgi:hypothetical protein